MDIQFKIIITVIAIIVLLAMSIWDFVGSYISLNALESTTSLNSKQVDSLKKEAMKQTIMRWLNGFCLGVLVVFLATFMTAG